MHDRPCLGAADLLVSKLHPKSPTASLWGLFLGRTVLRMTAGMHRCKPAAAMGREAVAVSPCSNRAVFPACRFSFILSIYTVHKCCLVWGSVTSPTVLQEWIPGLQTCSAVLYLQRITDDGEVGVGKGPHHVGRKHGVCKVFLTA